MSMRVTNGHVHQEPPISYQVGSVLAVVDASCWGKLPDIEVEILSRISFLYASQSLPRLDRGQFVDGYKESYWGYIEGLI